MEKLYKGWEIMKMIEEREIKEDTIIEKHNSCGYVVAKYVLKHNRIWEYKKEHIEVSAGLFASGRNFVIRQPRISFIEAMEKLEKGKTIKCCLNVFTNIYKPNNDSRIIDKNGIPVTTMEILKGKWYVEEEE